MTDKTDKKHGGLRTGAGRKKGSGLFGETTQVMRIPASKTTVIKDWLQKYADAQKQNEHREALQDLADEQAAVYLPAEDSHFTDQTLPLYSHKVVAGFPNPADDFIAERLNLNDKLIRNIDTTFLLTVQGDSMKNVGILNGDILVVDKAIKPTDGKIVIAALDGELTVKRLSIKSTGTWLVPENDNYPPIPVREESEVMIWGVVTATIHQF